MLFSAQGRCTWKNMATDPTSINWKTGAIGGKLKLRPLRGMKISERVKSLVGSRL